MGKKSVREFNSAEKTALLTALSTVKGKNICKFERDFADDNNWGIKFEFKDKKEYKSANLFLTETNNIGIKILFKEDEGFIVRIPSQYDLGREKYFLMIFFFIFQKVAWLRSGAKKYFRIRMERCLPGEMVKYLPW
jgi:hypothetical protein